eukprot:8174811-Pyramimonas_sp.AAC.2
MAWHARPPGKEHYEPLSEFETKQQIEMRVAKLMPPNDLSLTSTVPMHGVYCPALYVDSAVEAVLAAVLSPPSKEEELDAQRLVLPQAKMGDIEARYQKHQERQITISSRIIRDCWGQVPPLKCEVPAGPAAADGGGQRGADDVSGDRPRPGPRRHPRLHLAGGWGEREGQPGGHGVSRGSGVGPGQARGELVALDPRQRHRHHGGGGEGRVGDGADPGEGGAPPAGAAEGARGGAGELVAEIVVSLRSF